MEKEINLESVSTYTICKKTSWTYQNNKDEIHRVMGILALRSIPYIMDNLTPKTVKLIFGHNKVQLKALGVVYRNRAEELSKTLSSEDEYNFYEKRVNRQKGERLNPKELQDKKEWFVGIDVDGGIKTEKNIDGLMKLWSSMESAPKFIRKLWKKNQYSKIRGEIKRNLSNILKVDNIPSFFIVEINYCRYTLDFNQEPPNFNKVDEHSFYLNLLEIIKLIIYSKCPSPSDKDIVSYIISDPITQNPFCEDVIQHFTEIYKKQVMIIEDRIKEINNLKVTPEEKQYMSGIKGYLVSLGVPSLVTLPIDIKIPIDIFAESVVELSSLVYSPFSYLLKTIKWVRNTDKRLYLGALIIIEMRKLYLEIRNHPTNYLRKYELVSQGVESIIDAYYEKYKLSDRISGISTKQLINYWVMWSLKNEVYLVNSEEDNPCMIKNNWNLDTNRWIVDNQVRVSGYIINNNLFKFLEYCQEKKKRKDKFRKLTRDIGKKSMISSYMKKYHTSPAAGGSIKNILNIR